MLIMGRLVALMATYKKLKCNTQLLHIAIEKIVNLLKMSLVITINKSDLDSVKRSSSSDSAGFDNIIGKKSSGGSSIESRSDPFPIYINELYDINNDNDNKEIELGYFVNSAAGICKQVCSQECTVDVCTFAHPNHLGSRVAHPKYCLNGCIKDCHNSLCPFNHFQFERDFVWYRLVNKSWANENFKLIEKYSNAWKDRNEFFRVVINGKKKKTVKLINFIN